MARLVHHLGGFLFVGNSHTYQPKELGGIPGAFARLAGASGQDVSLAATDIGPERLRPESDMKLSKFRAFQFSCRHLMTHINTYQYISCISHACVYSHGA